MAPTTLDEVPAEQEEQLLDPALEVYLPAGHTVQLDDPELDA